MVTVLVPLSLAASDLGKHFKLVLHALSALPALEEARSRPTDFTAMVSRRLEAKTLNESRAGMTSHDSADADGSEEATSLPQSVVARRRLNLFDRTHGTLADTGLFGVGSPVAKKAVLDARAKLKRLKQATG